MKRNFLILLISLALLCGGVVEKIGFGSALAQGQLEQEELLERLREVEEEVEYLAKRAKKLTEEVARLQEAVIGDASLTEAQDLGTLIPQDLGTITEDDLAAIGQAEPVETEQVEAEAEEEIEAEETTETEPVEDSTSSFVEDVATVDFTEEEAQAVLEDPGASFGEKLAATMLVALSVTQVYLLYDLMSDPNITQEQAEHFAARIAEVMQGLNALQDGRAPLHEVVARSDNPEVVKALVNQGADVDLKDAQGNTALFTATENSARGNVEVLLDAGADINIENNQGETPWDIAQQRGDEEIIRLYQAVDTRGDYTPTQEWSQWSEDWWENVAVEDVQKLLDAGHDVNAANDFGETPLHWAAYYSPAEVVELLLQHGADVNARTNYGATPLHWAAGHSTAEVVELLLQHGADVNARANGGATPLDVVLHFNQNNREIAQILKAAGGVCNRNC